MQEGSSLNRKWQSIFMVPIIFVAIPLLLRISCIRSLILWFLQPLGDAEFKSVYIETLGALLGTFLAVVGALWVQRKADKAEEEKIVREQAMIVYYDFAFAFQDIVKFMQEYYSCDCRIITNVLSDSDWEKYRKRKRKYRFYIDTAWISNVAKLSSVLQQNEIKKVYEWYGDLYTIQQVFNAPPQSISKDEDQVALSIMFHKWCNQRMLLDGKNAITVTLKEEVKDILDRLATIANISDIQDANMENGVFRK